MNTSAIRATGLFCALLATSCLTGPALAQTEPPPRFETLDANGVDLVTGRYVFSMTEGSIGSGDGAVSIVRSQSNEFGRTDQWSGSLYQRTAGGTTLVYLQFGTISETFTISGSTYTSTSANGGTLVVGGADYLYTAPDGTKVDYALTTDGHAWAGPNCTLADAGTCALPIAVTRPNGTSFDINWDVVPKCAGGYDEELNCLQPTAYFRFDGASSTTHWAFSYTYVTDSPGNFSAPQTDWYKRTGATFTNNVAAPSPLPSVSYSAPSAGVEELTDMAGRVWRFTTTSNRLTGIRRPGLTSDNITIAYDTNGYVTSVTRDGVATTYSRSVSGTTGTMTVTNALSQATVIVSDLTKGRPTSVTDALSRTRSYTYDTNGRLTRITEPEGNYVNYTYDSRGNVTETRRVAKSGSGLSDIVTSATFPSSCTNALTCNKPTTTTDARGNVTDYTYDSTHGGLLTVTAPAPTTGAVRPETRYTYTLTNGEYRVTGVSACQTTSSCSGGSDEAKATFAYDAYGNVTSTSKGNGSGTLTATTAMTYDAVGNLATVDGPLSGTDDTIRYRYNAGRERVGEVSADPDGGSALKHRAVRTTINSEGLVSKVERGTVNSQSDSDWSAFSALEAVETAYDANARPVTQKLMSGSTAYELAQTSYDAVGRVECVARRMNPSEFASLPSSACTLDTEGSHGADRIVKTIRDAAGQVTQTKTALGAAAEADETTSTFSSNGRLATLTDAEGNKTTYEYDGHDRLLNTRFPSPTTDGVSAPTSGTGNDFEQLTYDAGSNVTQRRMRDGQTIAFAWDNLGRMTSKDVPNGVTYVYDAHYRYDNLGRLTWIGEISTTPRLTYGYDALGRRISETDSQHGAKTFDHDLAGRVVMMTWPDDFSIEYDYFVTGETKKIREEGQTSGAGVLAVFGYDDLGRRVSLARGNGTSTAYAYDSVSRLNSLAQDISGSDYDVTLGFSYNPASEIVSNTRSDDSYAFGQHVNVNRNYTANGLNQYTAIGSVSPNPTYDSRGNLTSAGSVTYGYSPENRLASAGTTLTYYDPVGRLRWYTGVGGLLDYAGDRLITEYHGSNGSVLRRYVHGPGADEPLVWYEGSSTSSRRYLHADERGSIIAVTDSSGAIIQANAYDEYGVPASTNLGRFQYTGQAWLPGLSLYNYKARIYSPTLGRFMQTDPIGYGDGMNIYAYVKADPVNGVDSTGLCGEENPCESFLQDIRKLGEDEDFGSALIAIQMMVFDRELGFDPWDRNEGWDPWRDACLDVRGCRPARDILNEWVDRWVEKWNRLIFNSPLSRCTRARGLDMARSGARGGAVGSRGGSVAGPPGQVVGGVAGAVVGAAEVVQEQCTGPGNGDVGRVDARDWGN